MAEHLFDVANQLNRGAELLIDHDEKVQVAANRPESRAKGQSVRGVCVSARVFCGRHGAAGRTRLEQPVRVDVQLVAGTRGMRASNGDFETAWQLIEELLRRAASKVDEAAVYHLKVQLHVMKSEIQQAVDTALDMPARVRHRHARASDRGASPG